LSIEGCCANLTLCCRDRVQVGTGSTCLLSIRSTFLIERWVEVWAYSRIVGKRVLGFALVAGVRGCALLHIGVERDAFPLLSWLGRALHRLTLPIQSDIKLLKFGFGSWLHFCGKYLLQQSHRRGLTGCKLAPYPVDGPFQVRHLGERYKAQRNLVEDQSVRRVRQGQLID